MRTQEHKPTPTQVFAESPETLPTTVNNGAGTDLDVYRDLVDTAGAGLEDARVEELLTPFLGLLQPLSPQLDRSRPEYIPEARDGMFINTLTNQVFSGEEGLQVIPCARDYLYGEWIPRDLGGGFRGQHSPDEPLVMRLKKEQGAFKKLVTVEGTELVEQFNVFALVGPAPLTPENAERVVMAFTSTKITVYKGWFSRIANIRYPVDGRSITPAMYAHLWQMTSVSQSNKQGRFWNIKVELSGGPNPRNSLIRPNELLFQMGKEFSELVRSGRAKADFSAESADTHTEDAPPF